MPELFPFIHTYIYSTFVVVLCYITIGVHHILILFIPHDGWGRRFCYSVRSLPVTIVR